MMRGVRRGCVRLRAAVIGIDDEDDSTFTITVDHKTFHFQVSKKIKLIYFNSKIFKAMLLF